MTMKKIFAIVSLAAAFLFTSCIQETNPQSSTITAEQAANAPGAFQNFVDAITNSLCGQFTYNGNDNTSPWDFGYPSFFLQRDVMGQDIAVEDSGSEWYTTWYTCGPALGPGYAITQLPWTYYYGWIKNCNVVIAAAGENPSDDRKAGLGIAHAMRAMFYMDLARMYTSKNYIQDKNSPTVPIVKETTTTDEANNNPRATNEEIWAFILDDLNKAETELEGFVRADKNVPDVSVVYGLKARAYLETGDWSKAKEFAQKAKAGYTLMNQAQYLSQTDGFNKPNDSWMFACTFKPDDKNIQLNDADSCWGSQMIIEVSPSGCGYSANYVGPKRIDAHLYSTIPATDFRRMCWIDPAIDELTTKADMVAALAAYSDDPNGLFTTGYQVSARQSVGLMPVKFRPKDGEHADQYAAFTVSVPLMRVEEMYLIEAEAAGMLNESEGQALLEAFAKTRDASYVYGSHNEGYNSTFATPFQNEVWWQRRVEFWGEGLATFDIKRLSKGIIRSYAGTNHIEGYLWNTTEVPAWMTLCFVGTEANYNKALVQNPTPIPPTEDSDPFNFN